MDDSELCHQAGQADCTLNGAALPQSGGAWRITVDSGTIDELDLAIGRLARELHAKTYRMLVLVREFDDRFGYAKWSFKTCAEWLAYRCQISASAAREKVRTAQALRFLPAISAAFEQGRISYSKVRALTRVAREHDEDLLLAYALDASGPQVEERCRRFAISRRKLPWRRAPCGSGARSASRAIRGTARS